MTQRCPGCGAALPPERSCQAIFDELLALEFTDPAYGAVHFLTVACYMIQHGQYSPEGLAWIARQLRAHLEQGLPVEQIRQAAAQEADQQRREWKVNRRPGDPPQPFIPWSVTIVDVAQQAADPTRYRQQVRTWARATLSEMQPLLVR